MTEKPGTSMIHVRRQRSQHAAAHRRSHGALMLLLFIFACVGLPGMVTAQRQETKKPQQIPDKLAERLIRKATGEHDPDIMAEVLRLMGRSIDRLQVELDLGPPTQSIQQETLDRLDEAIKIAATQRRPRRGRPDSGRGDKRRSSSKQGKQANSSGATGENGAGGEASAGDAMESSSAARAATGNLKDTRRAWGHLPMREREEIIQGIGERVLERYRSWIERYYKALQEVDK